MSVTRKPVICIETGRRFETITDAARAIGTTREAVSVATRYGIKCCGLHFVYAELWDRLAYGPDGR